MARWNQLLGVAVLLIGASLVTGNEAAFGGLVGLAGLCVVGAVLAFATGH